MLAWLKRTLDRGQTARKLYGSIVTQARRAAFYADWGVPDTPQGRFEMIVLHLTLVVRRLGREGDTGQRLAQAVNERFVTDMDDSMREMTFGDLRVPKEIKQVTAALLDRHKAYSDGLAGDDRGLQEALADQLAYLGVRERFDLAALANYMRHAETGLSLESRERVLEGNLVWPRADTGAAPST